MPITVILAIIAIVSVIIAIVGIIIDNDYCKIYGCIMGFGAVIMLVVYKLLMWLSQFS